MVPILLKILENWIKLTANIVTCRLTWIFYKFVNTAVSFQSFSDLISDQYQEEQDQAPFVRT